MLSHYLYDYTKEPNQQLKPPLVKKLARGIWEHRCKYDDIQYVPKEGGDHSEREKEKSTYCSLATIEYAPEFINTEDQDEIVEKREAKSLSRELKL